MLLRFNDNDSIFSHDIYNSVLENTHYKSPVNGATLQWLIRHKPNKTSSEVNNHIFTLELLLSVSWI